MIKNKKILLGITGGIAAYKSAELVRELVKAGYQVRVVMTEGAQQFITPLTLQALSKNPVHTDLFDAQAEAAMSHIELARWPDLILVAPASADYIARMTYGHANDLLTTLCLATESPIVLAPAMNRVMWQHAATQANVQCLAERGVLVWGPDSGEQACGEVGEGRMLEPESLKELIEDYFTDRELLKGKKILITAGPTQECIDPVRYFTNFSSGKMGYALAKAAQAAGARVILISGPSALSPPVGVELISVTTAQQMHDAVMQRIDDQDIFIANAAVADYRPKQVSKQKIKKSGSNLVIELERNPDILLSVTALDKKPYLVGFAAETENLEKFAQQKLADKQLDLLVANEVGENKGFSTDVNAVSCYQPNQQVVHFPLMSKQQLAVKLIQLIAKIKA